jgi:hypothetical protein
MKGPSWVAKRKTTGHVLSTVERANEEVSIGVMELANRVGCTHTCVCRRSRLWPEETVTARSGTGRNR